MSIGTNALIETGPSGITYVKRYAVQVVDSAGQAKRDIQITPSIDLLRYFKGSWRVAPNSTLDPDDFCFAEWCPGGYGTELPGGHPATGGAELNGIYPFTDWRAGRLTVCENEDLNRNGVAEDFFDTEEGRTRSEDQNGSGSLQPPRPKLDPRKADISVTAVGSTTTDANGIVVLKIEYPQNLASWVEFNILVSASGIGGTEGRASYKGILEYPAPVINTTDTTPAFVNSPYGTEGSKAYKRTDPQGNTAFLCTNPN